MIKTSSRPYCSYIGASILPAEILGLAMSGAEASTGDLLDSIAGEIAGLCQYVWGVRDPPNIFWGCAKHFRAGLQNIFG